MSAILAITFPLFAAITIGYSAVRLGWFKQSDMRVLGSYVMQIALPALIFRAVATRNLSETINPGYMLVFACAGLATIAVAYIWFGFTAPDRRRRAMAVMGSCCPNSGFVGFPLILLLYPDLAGIVLAQNMLIENTVIIPVCLILMDLAEDKQGASPARIMAKALFDLVKRPMVIGLIAGILVSLSGFALPAAVDRLFAMLAASSSALALVLIGGSLVGLPLYGNRALAAQIAAAKLMLHPLLAALCLAALTALGLVTLGPSLGTILILSTAMPMMSLYTVIAQERGLEGAASLAMLAATSGSYVTLSLLLYWLV